MVYWSEDKCFSSEPVFVPRTNGESEDDGRKIFDIFNVKGPPLTVS